MIEFFYWAVKVGKQVVHLNVADFSYFYLPQNIEYMLALHSGLPKRGLVIRIVSFFRQLIINLWTNPLKTSLKQKGIALFFAVTQNQDRALRSVAQKMPNSYFMGVKNYGDHKLPLFWAYLLAIPFFPFVAIKLLHSRGLERTAFYYVLDEYWLSYGYYIYLRWLLYKYKPVAVIISNDHVFWTRSLIKIAADEGIPTIYIQHASIVNIFPPLTVDYAFLEGIDSLEKYQALGLCQSKTYLVGMPRFDQYTAMINRASSLVKIGICVGARDPEKTVKQLCSFINSNLSGLSFVLRPHPSDSRKKIWQQIATAAGWGFSDARNEDAFEFLSKVDAIMAGESNILLEAALLNVLPIYYDFSDNQLDWYGFYKNGLVNYFSEPEAVANHIRHLQNEGRPYIRSKAKRYCDTIDTNYDGRSSELCVNLISQIIYKTT